MKKIIFYTFYILLQNQSKKFMLSDEFLCKPFMLTTINSVLQFCKADCLLQKCNRTILIYHSVTALLILFYKVNKPFGFV